MLRRGARVGRGVRGARALSGDVGALRRSLERKGWAKVPSLMPPEATASLRHRMSSLLGRGAGASSGSVFSTLSQESKTDEYFLASGDNISFFLEEGAVGPGGELVVPRGQAFNKAGHTLHRDDPVFRAFSSSPLLERLVVEVGGTADPVVLQSMYIFKNSGVGGVVSPHQDTTFLWTEPHSCLGLWCALAEASVSNGCLWALPGSHLRHPVVSRFRRRPDGKGVYFEPEEDVEAMRALDEGPGWEPLEAKEGDVILLHGGLIHRSAANTGGASRPAYTLHTVSASAAYPEDNWLQSAQPFPSFQELREGA